MINQLLIHCLTPRKALKIVYNFQTLIFTEIRASISVLIPVNNIVDNTVNV